MFPAVAAARSRFVAATTRTSTGIGSLPPTRLDHAFLQHAEQVNLRLGWQLADLVEEDGTAVRQFEAADAAFGRAGEGAGLVAEQFARQHARRQGRTIHLHQQALAARAEHVDGPRHQLLAGARLAEDEDGAVGRRDLRDRPPDGLHGRSVAEQETETPAGPLFVAQVGVLAFGAESESCPGLALGRPQILRLPGDKPFQLAHTASQCGRVIG